MSFEVRTEESIQKKINLSGRDYDLDDCGIN